MKQVKSLAELKRELNRRVENALRDTEFRDVLKETMAEHVWSDVYDVYTPKKYVRREDEGGLADKNKMIFDLEKSGGNYTLKMMNITEGNPWYEPNDAGFYISRIIETGKGYNFKGAFRKPRPFIANTREDLRTNEQHLWALRDALERQGLDTTIEFSDGGMGF